MPADRKVLGLTALRRRLDRERRRGRRIVFTNGCFDLLHAGHVGYLQKARGLGDLLVVAVNTDRSVRALKGRGRPLNPQQDRAAVLAALECVSYVTLFDEDTPDRVIRALRPDVLVKGGDYKGRTIVGAEFVRSLGGRVRTFPLAKGRSTTGLIRKMGASLIRRRRPA